MRTAAAPLLLLLLALPSGRAAAEDVTFYERKETDKFWSVTGGERTETGQATCFAAARRKDGSSIQIHRSLTDGELWILIRDNDWQISGAETGKLRWNFYSGRDRILTGGDFVFRVQSKNTIVIPDLAPKDFTRAMWASRYFTVVMPGDVPNLTMGFERSGAPTLAAMAECVKRHEKTYKGRAPKGGDEIRPLLKPDDKGQI